MKRKIYFTLNDFLCKLNEDEFVNIYDSTGYSINIKKEDIPKELLTKEVIKYKVDSAVPNIHFKLS